MHFPASSTLILLFLTPMILALPHSPKTSATPSPKTSSPNQQPPNQRLPNQQPSNQQPPNQQPPNQQPPNQQPPNQQLPNQQPSNQQSSNQQPSNQQQPPTNRTGSVNPALVPDFGIQRGQKIAGSADCAGLNGKAIPCQCPPLRDDYLKKLNGFVAAGNAFGTPVKFPEGNDEESKRVRKGALTVTLQNLEGPGKGCPVVSTRFAEL